MGNDQDDDHAGRKGPRDDGKDGYGYDPKRAVSRDLFEGMERRQADRLEKPARHLGQVLNMPKITPVMRRLMAAHAEIMDGPSDEVAFLHSTLCQTSLPRRKTEEREWKQRQGGALLLIEAGQVFNPRIDDFVKVGLPYGERPRLILIHLATEAVRTGSPVVDVGDSMTAYIRQLGIDTNGPSTRHFKDQLTRLAGAHVTLGIAASSGRRAVQIDGKFLKGIDLWYPDSPAQRVLWPSIVRLSDDYFTSLQQHAVPLDPRALGALSHSSLGLDIYVWMSQRLHRVPRLKPQPITWTALQTQFGAGYADLRKFRRDFLATLKRVQLVYPAAQIEAGKTGLLLRNSPPPIAKPMVQLSKLGLFIDGEIAATDVGPEAVGN